LHLDYPEGLSHAYTAWDFPVEKHTSARLTFEQDKLVAIAGLAALWSSIAQDEYLAGI